MSYDCDDYSLRVELEQFLVETGASYNAVWHGHTRIVRMTMAVLGNAPANSIPRFRWVVSIPRFRWVVKNFWEGKRP